MKTLLKLFLPAALCACSVPEDGPAPGGSGVDAVPHDMIVLGDKLDDP